MINAAAFIHCDQKKHRCHEKQCYAWQIHSLQGFEGQETLILPRVQGMLALVGKVGWHGNQEKYEGNQPCWNTIYCQLLPIAVSKYNNEDRKSYFSRNTHRHLPVLLIAPPMSGPSTYDMTNTAETAPISFSRRPKGTSSKHMIVGIA
jgi:hypothetical protein